LCFHHTIMTAAAVKDEQYWLHKLANLRLSLSGGDPAPHKPLLLLVILEMAEKGEITSRNLRLSPDLAFRFSVFWSVVAHRRTRSPDVTLPFYHLGSSGMWQPLMADGSPSRDKRSTSMVRIDQSFLQCLAIPAFRDRARRLLIETERYFRPVERPGLYTMLKIRPEARGVQERQEDHKGNVEAGREARFRIDVVVLAYHHACALTGYRMVTLTSESIVDACHIHSFRDSRNNDPRNGLALSKNAHWQFDRGLWSLDNDYRVVINKEKFMEDGVPGQRLADFEGRRIFLPSDPKYWPERDYIDWHRKQHGFGG